ncbi:MAG TPA: AI-2E family transporter [Acidimicrobiia bacterium]|nr:AI-2E family transporter [Acidimicrobiia bacterium]
MTQPAAPADHGTFVRRALTIAVVLLGVAAVVWLAFRLRTILFMVFVSVFITVAFEPPVHFLAKRGWRRGSATGLVFLVAFVLFALFVWALVPLFAQQVERLINSIPGIVESFLVFLDETLGFDLGDIDPAQAGRNLLESVQDVTGVVAGGVVDLASTVFGFLLFATTVTLFSFYMIAELPKLRRTVLSFMPETQQRHAMRVWEVAVEKMGGYIYSRLILAVVSAAVTYLFLTALGVPFAISLGIWVGILSQFVPVVGTYLASVFPALVALTFNDLGTMIWVIVFFIGYQQVENYVISPRITQRTMEIHPAISVAAILIGGTLLGGIGVVLALPMAGIIQAILSESRRSYDVILDEGEAVSET